MNLTRKQLIFLSINQIMNQLMNQCKTCFLGLQVPVNQNLRRRSKSPKYFVNNQDL